jgi:predicted MFS family arabinose efflux permease
MLLGIALGWGAGNVGAVAGPLSAHFHVSLAAVGLLSGTVYFASIMVATPLAVPLAHRVGIGRSCMGAAALMASGHALFAVGPGFAGLLVARVLVGAGTAVALIAGPVLARTLGGVRLLGLFGGSISFGIATALGLGGGLQDAGVSWHVGFVIAAAIGALPLVALPLRAEGAPAARPDRAFVAAALRSGSFYRLLALFIAVNGMPLIVGAWLVPYLAREAGLRTAVAGGLGFVVFGLTTLVRPLGARLAARRGAYRLLAAAGSLTAACGVLALALSHSLPLAAVSVALMGVGFALPYAAMIDAAQTLFPGQATATLALEQTGPNVVPMLVIPIVGTALSHGGARLAFGAMAAFVAVAGFMSSVESG